MCSINGGTKQGTRLERRFDLAVEEGTIQPAPTAVESIAVQRADSIEEKESMLGWSITLAVQYNEVNVSGRIVQDGIETI